MEESNDKILLKRSLLKLKTIYLSTIRLKELNTPNPCFFLEGGGVGHSVCSGPSQQLAEGIMQTYSYALVMRY